ncbi:hypothetical protein O6H91_05G062600 [Diphasiastrum complanatum]|uniref:Uncharacterized protein n=1 Tax=Diphasiastrum complanatum TaxID=34168 RepID=A0ACC2DNS3_DIPCM|nr:hypothetical protein O6H91_05G062600 [Diphasiastrum complanatum]
MDRIVRSMCERPSRALRLRPLRSRIEAAKAKSPRVTPELRAKRWSPSSVICQKNLQCEVVESDDEVIVIDPEEPPVIPRRRKRAPVQLRVSLRLQRLKCSTEQKTTPVHLRNVFLNSHEQPVPNVKRHLRKANGTVIKTATKLQPPGKAKKPLNNPSKSGGKRHPQSSTETVSSSALEVSGPVFADIACEESSEISDAAKVKNTIRIFNAFFLQAVQEEEVRFHEDQKKNLGVKRASRRPDLQAVTKMRKNNAILFAEKQIGHLPGINVGDHFYSRAEMVAVGLHKHWLSGIDYIGGSKQLKGFELLPLAVSIVMSGGYEDDVDNCEDVIYTGEGGNNLIGDRRQIADQKMIRGNLALKNSIEQGNFVRVIRGHRSSNSYSGKVYTYDGLYKVINYWAEKGISGHTVYKYRLKRAKSQAVLTTDQVHFCRGNVPKCPAELRGLVCEDISKAFTYSTYVEIPKSIKMPAPAVGCSCERECVDPYKCSCARLNGNSFPYVGRDGGRLVEAKDIVFECGPRCGCGSACVNRATQRGLHYRLEVFRTPHKGWGVRSWDLIPSGAFVCEYTGKVVVSDELDAIIDDTYVFALDCMLTMRGIGGRERRLGGISKPIQEHLGVTGEDKKEDIGQAEYSIDAGKSGNVSRFINHSCDPNLFVQCVLTTHHDVKLARIVFFANDNIPPLQELSYDYGYILDSVVGDDGKVKKRPCFCGADICRKRLY